ncbi:hypothetical protein QWJ26_13260 [Streptomyces sp. CSDS2]|uniref:hypothetical protein n=1 Tax=Streptomyces sp. CSDS2 TaxID=3055051 RepID=UPI0025B17592|nr:hypothetical protein [Streptomyces sp. CSDS2]MDN3260766.1 hypothetical protein [Streptomyces sp. CSDS2]
MRGTAPGDAVTSLTARWQSKGADPVQVRTDLTALAADLDAAGLLHPPTGPIGTRCPEYGSLLRPESASVSN